MALVDVHAKVSVELFPDRIDQLTNTPTGPVGTLINQTADALLAAAIPKIGTRYSDTTGKAEPGRSSGRIRDSGSVVSIGGSSYAVVFTHSVAFLHHEGSRSHIYSKDQWYINKNVPSTRHNTAFRRHGFVPFSHPGTTGNPYLTDAATDLGLRPSGALLRGKRPTRLFRLRQP